MTEARDSLGAWVNLKVLATPVEIARRHALAERGRALLPPVAAWVRDAAPLVEWPAIEVEGSDWDAVLQHIGVSALEDVRFLLEHLVDLFIYDDETRAERFADLVAAYPELVANESAS